MKNGFTRRHVVAGLASGTLTVLTPAKTVIAAGELFHEVAPGLFVHRGQHAIANAENRGDIANVAVVVGTTGVAVIDTGGSAGLGQRLLQAVRVLTPKPLRYVINTHMHPDHILGNAAFADHDVVFAGHHKLPRALAARGERYLSVNEERIGSSAAAGTRIVPPTLLVEGRHDLDLGGRVLTLAAHPTAHTDNDLTVLDTATSTLIMGDLLFCEHVPTLDGSIRGWLALLPELQRISATRAVPGHGPAAVAWPSAAGPQLAYLNTLVNDVKVALAAGTPLSQAVETAGLSQKSAWQLFDEHHKRNVTAAFAELEWD